MSNTKNNTRGAQDSHTKDIIFPNPEANSEAVRNLLYDLDQEVREFQAESNEEEDNIIHGLECLIKTWKSYRY